MTAKRSRHRMGLAAVAVAAALATTACPSNLHPTYKGFQGAVEKGAGCADLFHMRNRLDPDDEQVRADADLARIGCTSPGSLRSDR